MVVIDECHYCFQVNNGFRSEFKKINEIIKLFDKIPKLFFTATISKNNIKELINDFDIDNYLLITKKQKLIPNNIYYYWWFIS